MTRTKDTSLSMPERIAMLKQFDPHLLVSIHLNSAGYDTVQGTSTYYRYIGFRPLSVAILDRMLTLGLKEYGNVGNFNFSLSGPTDYPNALVEVAFLSNPADEKKILNPKFHKAVAQKIYLGIVDWLKQMKTMNGYLMQEREWIPGRISLSKAFPRKTSMEWCSKTMAKRLFLCRRKR